VQVAFALTLRVGGPGDPAWRRHASRLLTLAGMLVPIGFFLGGLVVQGSDPFLGIALVPLGALCLFLAVLLTAWNLSRTS